MNHNRATVAVEQIQSPTENKCVQPVAHRSPGSRRGTAVRTTKSQNQTTNELRATDTTKPARQCSSKRISGISRIPTMIAQNPTPKISHALSLTVIDRQPQRTTRGIMIAGAAASPKTQADAPTTSALAVVCRTTDFCGLSQGRGPRIRRTPKSTAQPTTIPTQSLNVIPRRGKSTGLAINVCALTSEASAQIAPTIGAR